LPGTILATRLFHRNHKAPPLSVANAIAIKIAETEWTKRAAEASCKQLFRKKQTWLPGLIERLLHEFPDRIPIEKLTRAIASDAEFRQQVKIRNLKPIPARRIQNGRSIIHLDWDLPKFESAAELACHFGISGRELHWLSAISTHAEFRPRHYVATWIKKRSSGFRLVESPKSKLKLVQRFILDDILSRVPVHESAHGFRKSRSVLTFVSPHVGRPFCIRMDLRDFFPSVTAGRVMGLFRSWGFDSDVARQLAGLCTTITPKELVEPQRPSGCIGSFRVERLYGSPHLPQGAPTSPALANLAAYNFDCRLTKLAESVGATYTRYADDILLSGTKDFARSAKQLSTLIGAIALEESFEVNFHKTRMLSSAQRQKSAGIVFNETLNLDRREFDRLKAIVHNCVRFGPASQNRNGLPNFRLHLEGRINWLTQLNPVKGEKLRLEFEKIDWEDTDREV
jgi:retron-type reverse transcriptase